MAAISKKEATDLRVVEFIKASSASPLRDQLNQDANNYVCLGHFDRFHAHKVERASNVFLSIEQDYRSKNNNYTYPLYLLHYPIDSSILDTFWDTPLCCMAVSRVHFDPFSKREATAEKGGKEQDIADLQKALASLSDELPSGCPRLGETTILVEGELVHCVFYHTLELGDIVAVLKSNSMGSCLHTLRRLLETAAVGDVYTYCGIHTALFMGDSVETAAKKWEEDFQTSRKYSCYSVETALQERLPIASIRFSVRNARCAKKFWDTLPLDPPEGVSFVTGTADAIVHLDKHTFLELVTYIKGLLQNRYPVANGRENTFEVDMYDAFDDIITRVGIPYGDVYSGAEIPKRRWSTNKIQHIQDALKRSVGKLSGICQPWAAALTAQTNTLITMMENCVMDDLSMLIWPSVCAIMERLDVILPTVGEQQEADIRKFLDGWDILANDITQLEGQLVQSPEVQSSRYYTPATLLAFYMALLHAYNALLLTVNDDEYRQNFVPLITYDIAPRANTLCILDSNGSGMGAPYQGNTPLLVYLPVSLMYHPFEVSVILCHEMAHYTGDSTRFREERLSRILCSCAGRIATAWRLDGQAPYPLRSGGYQKITQTIEDELRKGYQGLCTRKNVKNIDYISQIRDILPEVLTHVYFSQSLQSSLLSKYLREDTVQYSFISYAKMFTPKFQYLGICELKSRLEDLLLLYRECYADLAAVLCLGLTADEYLTCILYREETYVKERTPRKDYELQLNKLYFQATLVLIASASVQQTQFPPAFFCKDTSWLEGCKEKIHSYRESIESGRDIVTPEAPKETISIAAEYVVLEEYLKKCARTLTKDFQMEPAQALRKNIRDMLSAVSAEPDFKKLHEIIDAYREDLFKTGAC